MDLKMLKGMSLDDLLDVDFTKLKEDEVAYVEKRLIKTANRRINSLRKSGLISQSHLTAKEKKGLNSYNIPNQIQIMPHSRLFESTMGHFFVHIFFYLIIFSKSSLPCLHIGQIKSSGSSSPTYS